MTCLAIDLLGADTPEEELCRGAIAALKKNPDLHLFLCGHASLLDALTGGNPEIAGRFTVVDSPVAVTNYDNPMEAYKISDACISCGACAAGCPVEAISEGASHYEINADVCVDCGACAGTCPVGAPNPQ